MNDALETRLAEALDARARLKRVDTASLEHRRAQVHAAVDDGVVSLDVDGGDPSWRPDVTDRRRRPVVVLATAAATLVLVVAGVGLAHRTGGSAPPAAGDADGTEHWRGYTSGFDFSQSPTDLEGVALLPDDVVPSSVRSLADLGPYRYWAGWDDDGGLHWGVQSPDGTELGSNTDPSTTDPQTVSDGSHAPELVLAPVTDADEQAWVPGGPEDSPLRRGGLTALSPSVWVDGDALGTAEDLFARLRDPQTTEDRFTGADTPPPADQGLPETERLLARDGERRFFVAESDWGEVCFTIAVGDAAAVTCQPPVVAATEGIRSTFVVPGTSTTAELASDDLDTSSWPGRALQRLSPNVWLEGPPSGNTLELADGTTALVGGPDGGARPDVRLGGRITVLDGGCLGLSSGGSTSVLVLQAGTTVSADRQGLVTPDGLAFSVGDAVQGGGGLVDAQRLERWKADFPECFAGRGVVAVDITALSETTG